MRHAIIALVGLTLGFCLSHFTLPRQEGRYYDCSLAEISPDFPARVKEECRNIRSQKIINSTIQQ